MKKKNFFLLIAYLCNTKMVFGAEEGMPQLNPEYWASQTFWLILIFSILYLIIWKIFLPKIVNNVEDRKSKIANDLNEAQKLKEDAEKRLKEYEEIIKETKKIAKKIVDDNKKNLTNDIKNKNQELNKAIEKELLAAENEINQLKNNSVTSINKIAAEISSDLIKQIVGTEVNMSNVSAVVQEISKKKLESSL
mgnify:CR=1 FL=1